MDSPNPNPLVDLEAALLDWHERLAARERTLAALQENLISWSGVLAQMATVLGEISALQRGEFSHAATGDRPVLKLVPAPPGDKETQQ